MRNNKGFSLVELIVVIAIMAILAAVAIPTFASFITKANEASDEQFVADLEYAIDLANTTFGKDITGFAITASNGVISQVEYTVGSDKVVLKVENDVATFDTSATDVTENTKVIEAAEDVINTMDWKYDFKSEKWADGNGSN